MQRNPVGAGEWVTAQFPDGAVLRAMPEHPKLHYLHGISIDHNGKHSYMEAGSLFTDSMLAALAASPAIIKDLVAQVKALQVALDEAGK